MFSVLNQLFLLYESYCHGTQDEECSRDEEHAHLCSADHLENESSACCSGDLRKADGTVEETEVCSDMLA